MEFFYTTEPVDMTVDRGLPTQQVLQILPISQEQASSGNIPGNRIYISTLGCVHNLQSNLDRNNTNIDLRCFSQSGKESVVNLPNFPIILSNFNIVKLEVLESLADRIVSTPFIPLEVRLKPLIDKKQEVIRVAILNGIGTGIGDSIVGLRSLQLFHIELKKYFNEVIIDLYQTAFNTNTNKRKIYEQEFIVNENALLPMSLDKLLTYDCVGDFSSMVLRDNFDNQPMIDFFLETLSIDPKFISKSAKRNFIKVSEKAAEDHSLTFLSLRQNNKPLLMIHPNASAPIRSIPPQALEKLVKHLLKNTDYNILITDDVHYNVHNLKIELKDKENRIKDLSYMSKDFETFIYAISQVDSIITADTCVYHIADSFSKPTVALFATIDPEFRTCYYPTVESIVIAPNNDIWGTHVSLEVKDQIYIWNLWNKLKPELVLEKLTDIEKRVYNKRTCVSCPVCGNTDKFVPSDRFLEHTLVTCGNGCGEFATNRIAQNYNEMYKTSDYSHYLEERPGHDTIVGYMNQYRFQYVKQYLENVVNKGKLLDVGCANGFLVGYAKQQGFDSYGIDASQAAIDYSHKFMKLKGKTTVCSNLDELPSNFPEKFDVITSFELVEHLEDPVLFAKQVYSRLKPGGVWIFSTPNRNRINFALGLKNTKKHRTFESGDYPAEHLSRFKSKGHSTLCENAGFNILYHNSSKLTSGTIVDSQGFFPEIKVNDTTGTKVLTVDQPTINKAIFDYYSPFTEPIKGYGDFLITIAQKPNNSI